MFNIRTMKTTYLIFILVFVMVSCGKKTASNNMPIAEKQYLRDWHIQSSTQIKVADKSVSESDYSIKNWIEAKVPTTVLRALVKAGIYPDPHLDMNNFKIPDASDDLSKRLDLNKYSHLKNNPNPFKEPWWFRTQFDVPQNKTGKKVWLNLDGINYRADIWINGKKLADANDVVGMFSRFKFDITDYVNIGEKNTLAIKIHQVDHVGNPQPGYQFDVYGHPRGQGADIFKDATLKFSAGWDCAPVVRDRNMGIYQDVYLSYTGAVDIIDPYIVTDLPLPDTNKADISISAELHNTSTKTVRGILKGSIDLMKEIDFYSYTKKMPGNFNTINFQKEIEIPAGKTIIVHIKPSDFPQLSVKNPYLWWPNGYGSQYLHTLNLSFISDGNVSDVEEKLFGIREISEKFKEIDGEFGRTFYVNGKRIFARGGWLQPDMMLDMNKKRIYNEARLLANANVNMIANEDMPAPPEHVMEAFDKYGLLIWETFFQCWTNDPYSGKMSNPIDADLAIKGAVDIIKRYRSNPSLVAWNMVVETMVRGEIYTPVRDSIKSLDPTRPFIATSSYGWDVDKISPYIKDDLPTGMTDEGAPDYTWYPHKYYYDMVQGVKQQMFRNEMGVPSVPTLSSMKKYVFNLGDVEKSAVYPLDSVWAHHGAWDDVDGHSYVYKPYDIALRRRYGEPKSVKDYIRKAQMVNAGSYRAMYEAANHRMWDITQGVMLWKLNSCWPTEVWQLYDWFLNPTSAYYFTKKALEPLHIQLNENDHTVTVVNTHHKTFNDLTADVKVYDFDLNEKWKKENKFNIDEDSYKELFKVPEIKGLKGTYFVQLILKNSKGTPVSDNFYWFSSANGTDKDVYEALKRAGLDNEELARHVDYSDLSALQPVDLDIVSDVIDKGNEMLIKIHVKNISNKLSFMNRLAITKGKDGEEVLPTIWSDNFITLLPGEEKDLSAIIVKEDLGNNKPFVIQNTY